MRTGIFVDPWIRLTPERLGELIDESGFEIDIVYSLGDLAVESWAIDCGRESFFTNKLTDDAKSAWLITALVGSVILVVDRDQPSALAKAIAAEAVRRALPARAFRLDSEEDAQRNSRTHP